MNYHTPHGDELTTFNLNSIHRLVQDVEASGLQLLMNVISRIPMQNCTMSCTYQHTNMVILSNHETYIG